MLKFSGWSCLISGQKVSAPGRGVAGLVGPGPADRRSCCVAARQPLGVAARVRQRHAARWPPTMLAPRWCSRGVVAMCPALQPTRPSPGVPGRSETATSAACPRRRSPWARWGVGRGGVPTLRQACSRPRSRAQYAFKDSMIHGILQFTLRIAFRCVLHRCGSQDIRC